MIRALWETAAAAYRLGMAKIHAATNPCPPHDHQDGKYLFCVKCGKYPDDPNY